MDIELTVSEQRVIGVLLEKESTTPEQYPLTLNALTSGCNQKSNREPVLSLTENQVQDTCNLLISKHLLIAEEGRSAGRVTRYRHRFCNTEFSDMQLTSQESAIICLLLLRGPQTPGELRTRSNRLCHFENVQAVESVLAAMSQWVVQLEREPGKRESRYMHVMGDSISQPAAQVAAVSSQTEVIEPHSTSLESRVLQLETELAELKHSLRQELTVLLKQELKASLYQASTAQIEYEREPDKGGQDQESE